MTTAATKRRSDEATEGPKPRAGLGKLTWEEQYPSSYVCYPTRTAKQLTHQVRSEHTKRPLPAGVAYVLGRLRCGYVLQERPICRWFWADGTPVSNHTRRAMMRRNMIRGCDGRVLLRPKEEWTEH